MKPSLKSEQLKKTVINKLSGGIKMLLLMYIASQPLQRAQAQCEMHDPPACNLDGPLKACVGQGHMFLTSSIAFSSDPPETNYSFQLNGTHASMVGSSRVSYSDSLYIETLEIDPGDQDGSINVRLDVAVTYPDGCIMKCECSKSITIRNIKQFTFAPPIACIGGSTTITAVGSGATTYLYSLSPRGDTNTTGVFNNVTAGTYTVHVQGSKEFVTCVLDTTLFLTAPQSYTPVSINCPGPLTEGNFLSQQQINNDFGNWISQFSTSGGTNPVITANLNQPAPDACGGLVDVLYTVSSDCEPPRSCTSRFTVPPVNVSCTNSGPINCTVTTINLTANGCSGSALTYSWNGPGGFSSSLQCPAATLQGTYTVTASFGACSASCTTNVDDTCKGFEGCTLGFWKNHVSIWRDASSAIPSCIANAISTLGPPYSGNGTTNSSFASTFGLNSQQMIAAGLSPDVTLVQALRTGGGGFFDLGRQGVAALLNSCGIKYIYNSSQVLVIMHNAYVSHNSNPINPSFDDLNETQPDKCPPAGRATKRMLNGGMVYNENVAMSAYPNPFSDLTTIEILPNVNYDNATVELYNLSGQKVSTLFAGSMLQDQVYRFDISGMNLRERIYIYNFKAGEDALFGKIVLIK